MRSILNAILAFIGAESLTDEEFEFCEGEIEDEDNSSDVYYALISVLEERESVTDMSARLRYYYLAKGIRFGSDVEALEAGAKSNIFVGADLDD
jgi:hypothetical protein